MNVMINDKLREDARDLKKDQFEFMKGNIQAVPYNITKTSALNANNKFFPFIEYYSCTDEEKQAFIDKLKYNGMTVDRLGKISDFMKSTPSYIKGKLIKLLNTDEDFHMAKTIANELDKGVFI